MVVVRVERFLLQWGVQARFSIRTLENIGTDSVSPSFDKCIFMVAIFQNVDEEESESILKTI